MAIIAAVVNLIFQTCKQKDSVDDGNVKRSEKKVWALHDSSYSNIYIDPMRSLRYAQREQEISEAIGFNKGKIRSSLDLGNVFWITGSYPTALRMHFKALVLADSLHDDLMARAYQNLGTVYNDMEDITHALKYTKDSYRLDLKSKDTAHLVTDYMNIGEIFEKVNRDSAFLYHNKSLSLGRTIRGYNLGRVYFNLGKTYDLFNNLAVAKSFYFTSIPLLIKKVDYHSLNQLYLALASFYLKTKQIDSSQIFAAKADTVAQKMGYSLGELKSNLFLYSLFKQKKIESKAFKYLEVETKVNQDMYSTKASIETSGLTYEEQRREEAQKIIEDRKKKLYEQNLEFALLGAFVPIFLGVVFFAWKVKIKTQYIEWAGLFGLLLFFEFLTMIFHHFLAEWTDERPFLMLPFLAGVAAIIFPIHHKIEYWLKGHISIIKNE